jgi:hypothetical protein
MAFDFPANPAPNQIYTSVEGIVFQWNGYAWLSGGSNSAATGAGEVGQARVINVAGDPTWGAPIDCGDY